jgi:prepilin-type N-terminal cleavage/methylation domain-containing protein
MVSKAAKVTMRTCLTISDVGLRGNSDSRQAFTLVEILVVVVLLALLAGATVGAYFGTYKRLLVEKAASDVYLAAKYARLLAVERRQSCLLALDEENGGFALMFLQDDAEDSDESGRFVSNQYSRPGRFADGVKYEQIAISPSIEPDAEGVNENIITFRSDGTADNAVIQIGDEKNAYTVYIYAATGKAKMKRGLPEEVAIGVIDLDVIEE